MITCPNRNLKSWIDLVEARGEDMSYMLWNKYSGVVPESEYSVPDINFYQKDSLEDKLKATGYFTQYNNRLFIKKDFRAQAVNTIGGINKETPGVIQIKKASNLGFKGRQIEYVEINPQMSAFQKSGEGKSIKDLNNLMIDYLRRAGFSVEAVEELFTEAGDPAIAKVQATRIKGELVRLVEFAKGKLKANSLPEEAAHVAVELSMENPLMQKLIDNIHLTPYYEIVQKEYGNESDYTENDLRKEAVGKLIADHVVNEYKNTNPSILGWLNALLKWLWNKLKGIDETTLMSEWDNIAKEFASDIVSGKAVELNTEMKNYQKMKKDEAGFEYFDNIEYFDSLFDLGDEYTIVKKKPLPEAVASYIESAKNTIKLLDRQLREKHAESNARIVAQIEKIETRLQELKEVKVGVFGLLVKYANEDIKEVEKSLNNFSEVKDKIRYFHLAMSRLSSWAKLDTIVESGDKEVDDEIGALSSSARRLMTKLNDTYKEHLNELAEGFTEEEFFQAVSDVGTLAANTLSIATSKIPELRYAYHVTEREGYFAEQKHIEFVKELREKEKEWKDYYRSKGMSDEQAKDIFLQENSKGEKTGNLVHQISQDFYEERDKQAKLAKSTKRWKAYFKWLENNTDKVVNEERWEIAQENAKMDLQNEDGTLDEKAYNAWFSEHNPYSPKSDFSKMREYVKYNPKVELWEDKKFRKIAADPKMLEFYSYISEFFADRRGLMPYAKAPENYLPEMAAGKEMFKNGTGGILKSLGKSMSEYFTVELQSDTHFDPQDITGQRIKGVPLYMMSNSLTPQEKELDVWKVMEAYDGVARTYEYRYKVEPIVLLIKDLFRQSKEQVLTPDGTPVTSYVTGQLQQLTGANKNAIEALSYFMDSKFYDENKEPYDATFKTKAKLDSEGNIVKEARGISVARMSDILAAWTRRKAMGLNAFAGAVNAIFGFQSILVHANGREDFTPDQVMKAFKICLNLGAPGTIGYNKLETIAKRYNIMNDYNEVERMSVDKVLFFFNEQTEKFIRSLTLVSKMLNTFVEIDGKKVNLFEAHGKDGLTEVEGYETSSDGAFKISSAVNAINDKLHGDYRNPKLFQKRAWTRMLMIFRTWLPEAVESRIGAEKYDERLGLDAEGNIRKSKGRLRTFSQAVFTSGETLTTDGKALGLGYVAKQFGGEMLRQLGNSFFLGNQVFKGDSFERLKAVDKANMLKNAAMLRMTIMVSLIGILLAGMAADDDDERSKLLLFALTNTYRLQGDMIFFLHPAQWVYMTQNIMPYTQTLTDIINFADSIPRAIIGERDVDFGIFGERHFKGDEIEGGPYDGQSYMWRRFLKALPVSSQAVKWIDLQNMNLE